MHVELYLTYLLRLVSSCSQWYIGRRGFSIRHCSVCSTRVFTSVVKDPPSGVLILAQVIITHNEIRVGLSQSAALFQLHFRVNLCSSSPPFLSLAFPFFLPFLPSSSPYRHEAVSKPARVSEGAL